MGLYSRLIFPFILDRAMARPALAEQRPLVLAGASGEVLEIGFGTGHNLPHYRPRAVRRLSILEPHPGLARRARRRLDGAAFPVRPVALLPGQRIDAPDASFDAVVSTWVLCSVPDVAATLAEVHRVLRPGGSFLFVEHGRAPDAPVARWQRRLNPLIRYFGDGCHLDRDFAALISASPLSLDHLDRFYLRDTPRVGGFTYRGTARKPE